MQETYSIHCGSDCFYYDCWCYHCHNNIKSSLVTDSLVTRHLWNHLSLKVHYKSKTNKHTMHASIKGLIWHILYLVYIGIWCNACSGRTNFDSLNYSFRLLWDHPNTTEPLISTGGKGYPLNLSVPGGNIKVCKMHKDYSTGFKCKFLGFISYTGLPFVAEP